MVCIVYRSAMDRPFFRDRRHAGRLLAVTLLAYRSDPNVVVLGLTRGGIPVAFEIAMVLRAPLDVCVVRRLGVPDRKELAMGAIASGGVLVLNDEVIEALKISTMMIGLVAAQEQNELERLECTYRGDAWQRDVSGRITIVVDDGLATGSTMRAAVAALRQLQPARIVVAVPVGDADTCARLRREVDELVCLHTPEPLQAVGLWYEKFGETSDRDVNRLLKTAATRRT